MAHIPYEATIAGTQGPPPYQCTGVKLFAFPLLADIAPLQTLCDQFLNIAPNRAGITFEPIPSAPNTCTVMIEALDYRSLKAPTPPWNDLGEVSQHELLFSVPVWRKHGGVLVESGIFVPYIFVDDQASALTGREVVGLPKLLADFTLDRNFPASRPIKMRFQERRASGPIRLVDLVKISTISGVAPLTLPMVPTPASMFGFSTRILMNPQSAATDSYRSIMRCVYASTPTATGPLAPAKVTLTPIVDLDIQSTLGIRPDIFGNVISLSPYFLEADFFLEDVTTLWES
jgi:hypothetical protein